MKKIIIIFILFASEIFSQDSNRCGVERWDVKTLTDDQANQVDLDNPVFTTVYKQTQLEVQDIGQNTPRLEDEKIVYKIRCWLLGFKTEGDRDYHLIIGDERRKGVTMVAEICDPTCPGVETSPAYNRFLIVRDKFERYFNGKRSRSRIRLHIQIEGVGFFDKEHPSPPTGNANNNREIHPITKLIFLR